MRWSAVLGLAALTFGGDSTALKQLSLSCSRAALAAGDIAMAGATLVGIGANVSAAFTSGSLGALSTGHSLASEAWRGIDVVNVSASRSVLRAISRDTVDMERYLSAPTVMGRDPLVLERLIRCAGNATRLVEVTEIADKVFGVEGYHRHILCRARILPQGHVAMAAVITSTSFLARWINPMWELVGLDTATEAAAILGTVETISAAFGPINPADLDVGNDAFPEASWVPRSGRCWSCLAAVASTLGSASRLLSEQAWICQLILAMAFLALYWAIHTHGMEYVELEPVGLQTFEIGSPAGAVTPSSMSRSPSMASLATTHSYNLITSGENSPERRLSLASSAGVGSSGGIGGGGGGE